MTYFNGQRRGYPRLQLIGRRFGKLTVAEFAGLDGCRSKWLCKCDCGGEKVTLGVVLMQGDCRSCGCLRAAQNMRNLQLAHRVSGKRRRTPAAVRDLEDATRFWGAA